MKWIIQGLAASVILLLVTGACTSGSGGDSVRSADDISGPALVLFYTDN